MIKAHTEIPTDIINNQSDMNMGGTGIGNSSPTINLDEINAYNTRKTTTPNTNQQYTEKDPFNPYESTGLEELKTLQNQIDQQMKELQELLNQQSQNQKPETTQGQHETNLQDLNKEEEDLQNALETLNNFNWGNIEHNKLLNDLMNKYGNEEIKKQWEKELNGLKGTELQNKITSLMSGLLKERLSQVKDDIYNIKNNSNYDNRSDSQIREDLKDSTAYQTVVEDMRKAGLNPAMLSGASYAGGGGGGSSRDEEEKEKRRRKKLEELERLRMQQQEELRRRQEVFQILGMLTGMGSFLGGGLIRNAGYSSFWEAQMAKNQSQTPSTPTNAPKTNTKQHTTKNEPAWLDKYLKEIENMG